MSPQKPKMPPKNPKISKRPARPRVYRKVAYVDDTKVYINAYKKGKTTYLRERSSGYIIARSRKLNKNQLLANFSKTRPRQIVKNVKYQGKDKKRAVIIQKQPINIHVFEIGRMKHGFRLTSKHVRRARMGQLHLKVTFYKGKRPVTKLGSDNSFSDLSDKNDYNRAFDTAFKGAMSQINFSPDRYIVEWIHYTYYENA